MKKLITLSLLMLAITANSFAQQVEVPVGRLMGYITDIMVYSTPNLQGTRRANPRWVNGALTLPFPTTNVSFTVTPGRIVYIKFCNSEFPTETAYTTNQTNINLANMCGIRSDETALIAVTFNGISTEIHNADCNRVFGEIKIRVSENSQTGVYARIPSEPNPFFINTNREFVAFTNANANTRPPLINYVFNSLPTTPNITSNVTTNSTTRNVSRASFFVGRNALLGGRVNIEITTNLGSAHKTCDLCDDFSSNIRMARPVVETISINRTNPNGRVLNAANNRVVLGPYSARGNRDGWAATATGGTFKKMNVHLTVGGLY